MLPPLNLSVFSFCLFVCFFLYWCIYHLCIYLFIYLSREEKLVSDETSSIFSTSKAWFPFDRPDRPDCPKTVLKRSGRSALLVSLS